MFIVGFLTPHNVCPNLSKVNCMAENSLTWLVNDIWLTVNRRESNARGAKNVWVLSAVSVLSSVSRTQPVCLHFHRTCWRVAFWGNGSRSVILAVFAKFSIISKKSWNESVIINSKSFVVTYTVVSVLQSKSRDKICKSLQNLCVVRGSLPTWKVWNFSESHQFFFNRSDSLATKRRT